MSKIAVGTREDEIQQNLRKIGDIETVDVGTLEALEILRAFAARGFDESVWGDTETEKKAHKRFTRANSVLEQLVKCHDSFVASAPPVRITREQRERS